MCLSTDYNGWIISVVAQATSVHPDVDYQNGVGFSTIVGGDICGVGFGMARGGGVADHLVSLTLWFVLWILKFFSDYDS